MRESGAARCDGGESTAGSESPKARLTDRLVVETTEVEREDREGSEKWRAEVAEE